MQEMEAILCAQKPVEITAAFSEMYKDDLKMNELRLQLQLFPDLIKTANQWESRK